MSRSQKDQQSFNNRKAAQQNKMAGDAQSANAANKRDQDARDAASYGGKGGHGWAPIAQ